MSIPSTQNAAMTDPRPDPTADTPLYTPENYTPTESVGYLLGQAKGRITAAIDAEMAPYDITGAQWITLLHLSCTEVETAGELCKRACVDTGSMTRMLDRLEKKGLVQRVRCCEDRRVVRLRMTEAGEKLAALMPDVASRVLNHHLRGFSRDELELLKSLLRRIIANADG